MPEIRKITTTEIIKVDRKHGVVLGWGIVCKQNGEDYYDLQDQHIPEEVMMAAAIEFSHNGRVAKEMHVGDQKGAAFVFPITTDIAKAFGFPESKTGMLVMYKPSAEEVAILDKFENGTYKGFSIGGSGNVEEQA